MLRRYLSDIDKTFILVVLGCMFVVSSIFVISGIFYHSRSFENEIKDFMKSQVTSTIVNLQHERRMSDFYRIKKVLAGLPNIESVAIYDKSCKQLTESYLTIYPEDICPSDKTVQTISYPDVLSDIGSVAFKIKSTKFNIWDYSKVILLSFAFASLCCFILTVLWRKMIYKPLITEIDGLASGQMPKLRQLGNLGFKVESLIRRNTDYEINLERVKDSELKARQALKVAHDILNPVMLLKTELSLNSSTAVKDAINNIESIAYDLLPEKAPIVFSKTDSGDLLSSILTQAKVFTNRVSLLPSNRLDIFLNTSKSHFLRVATNLLKNAHEATPADEQLLIGFFEKDGFAEFHILDQGSGFDGSSISTTKAQGSGLGLESTRALVSQLNAELIFIPQKERGTLTVLRVPLFESKVSNFSKVLLIEDDKYVRNRWRNSAEEKGISFEAHATLPETFPEAGTIIFLDRFLGDLDTSDWAQAARSLGLEVHSISSIDLSSKTPPWAN